jgi:hypothetical protein
MPHLHLPLDHTDADLVLAANLADIVGSEDLYVTWSSGTGAGAIPEVEAILVEQRPLNPLAGFAAAIAAAFAGLWRALRRGSRDAAAPSAPQSDPERRTAEPSA